MVLMYLLWACTPKNSSLMTTEAHDMYTISSLDQLDVRTSLPLPTPLHKQINEALQQRGIGPKSLQPIEGYAELRNSNQRIQLFSERPLLLIETNAQFFSQLEGRFRWTVDVRMHLEASDGTIFSRIFSVPVFHQFHHQREQESLEAAQPQILRELNQMLDDYVRGYRP
jgi:hypothetical protein